MKFHVTQRERLALTTFLVPKPTANLEQAHVRLQAWEQLGVSELAVSVADAAAMPGATVNPQPFFDNKTPQIVDITQPTLDFLLKGLEGEVPGVFSDVLRPLQDRLVSLRDRGYKLPYVPPPGDQAAADVAAPADA